MDRTSKYIFYDDYISEGNTAYVGKYKAYKNLDGWFVLINEDSGESIFSHWNWNEFFNEFYKIFTK